MKAQFTGKKLACALFVCLVALLLSAAVAVAQSSGTAALTGTVTDLSGASLANVTVTAINIGTNQQRTMTTGPDGVYKFGLLPPGDYRVQFSAKGFKTTEVPAVTLEVTETATVNRVLAVGTVTESVTVQAGAETIQTESSTVGGTVTGQSIDNLPTASRNYTEILGLATGAASSPENAAAFGKGTQDISVNGNLPTSNNYQMDGVGINSIAGFSTNDTAGIYPGVSIPNPDAIQEFKLQTSQYDASYGRNVGANVNVVTKSGTNQFHGTLFEFFRNSVFDADDYFYPKNSPGEPAHQTLDQNQFGFSLGGPIKKNKLFFFSSYEGTRAKNGVDPSIAEAFGVNLPPIPAGPRSTDPNSTWAQELAALNCPANHINPATGKPFSQFSAFTGGPPLECGGESGTNLNPIALALLNVQGPASSGGYYIPADDSPGCEPAPANSSLAGLYTCNFVIPAVRHEDQGVGNLDYMVNSKNTLSARFFQSTSTQPTNGNELPGYLNQGIYANTNALLRLTTVVSNNFINEAYVAYQRLYAHASDQLPAGDTPAALGITTLSPPGSPGGSLPPPINMLNDNTILNGFLYPVWTKVNQYEAADQISWSHRRQTIRAGAEYEKDQWNFTHDGITRGWVFIGGWNDLFVGQIGNIFECAQCIKASPVGLNHWFRLPAINAFVQDDWKVMPQLTFNLGLRWEVDGQISDAQGNGTDIWTNLLATVPNNQMPLSMTACGGAMCAASVVGNVITKKTISRYGQPPPGVFVANGTAPFESHAPYSNFAPRFGFSWQPTFSSKLVVRGGFGLFYDRLGMSNISKALNQGNPYSATLNYGFPNAGSLQNLYPTAASTPIPGYQGRYYDAACVAAGTCALPTNFHPGSPGSSYLTSPMIISTWHTPLVRQYNVGVQYEFVSGWVLDAGYAGNSGINLLNSTQNQNDAQLIPENQSITLNGSGGPVTITNNARASVTARVPYVGYAPGGVQETRFNGTSNYNSLQASVRHQFGYGLTTQAAYTWSKALGDIFFGTANANVATNLSDQRGESPYNRAQRLSVNYSYDLPFGKGLTGAAGKLESGWNVSGVTLAQSGDPILFIDSRLGAAYGTSTTSESTGYSYAQLCPGYKNSDIVTHGSIESKLNNYFNLNAFNRTDKTNSGTCPLPVVANNGGDLAAYDFGTLRPGAVSGPGAFFWNIAVMKTTKLTEGLTMQFRAESYNTFNHPNFGDPVGGNGSSGYNANVNSATFGHITLSAVNPRLIQFAVRFLF